nr:MAG TPA: hypothetical protein [Caudoviricetes sp.]
MVIVAVLQLINCFIVLMNLLIIIIKIIKIFLKKSLRPL